VGFRIYYNIRACVFALGKYLIRNKKIMRFITDDCIGCGMCVDTCPVNCISEGSPKFVIDESECINCGACEPVCPVGAIIEK